MRVIADRLLHDRLYCLLDDQESEVHGYLGTPEEREEVRAATRDHIVGALRSEAKTDLGATLQQLAALSAPLYRLSPWRSALRLVPAFSDWQGWIQTQLIQNERGITKPGFPAPLGQSGKDIVEQCARSIPASDAFLVRWVDLSGDEAHVFAIGVFGMPLRGGGMAYGLTMDQWGTDRAYYRTCFSCAYCFQPAGDRIFAHAVLGIGQERAFCPTRYVEQRVRRVLDNASAAAAGIGDSAILDGALDRIFPARAPTPRATSGRLPPETSYWRGDTLPEHLFSQLAVDTNGVGWVGDRLLTLDDKRSGTAAEAESIQREFWNDLAPLRARLINKR